MHGHTWKVKMCISGGKLDPVGILIDFKVLKNIMKRCLPDHCCLNTHVPQFKTINPTAENLADYLFDRFEAELPRNITLEFVKVWETDKACAIRAREVFIDGRCAD
jgi:6-pyruvoyltetrahydropterin/6-carboxytetrahydropterin synthase